MENKIAHNPLVSVCVQTYQHVNYIAKCIDGILMQRTNFQFEILLGEDESSDGTRDICIEYETRHPEKIRLFLNSRKEVLYINGEATGRMNLINLLNNANGKYIALCEGDDYWIDPDKLQKQVDFLEANSDYGLVHTDCDFLFENSGITIKNYNASTNRYEFGKENTYDTLIKNNIVKTVTVCFKKEFYNEFIQFVEEHIYKWLMFDYPLWIFIANNSKIAYLNKSTAIYRMLNNSASHFIDNFEKTFNFINSSFDIKQFFIKKYGCDKNTLISVNNSYKKFILSSALNLKKPQIIHEYLNPQSIEISNLEKLLYYYGAKNTITVFIAKGLRKILRKLKIYDD